MLDEMFEPNERKRETLAYEMVGGPKKARGYGLRDVG